MGGRLLLPTDDAAAFAWRFCPDPTRPGHMVQLHRGQVDFINHPAKDKTAACGRRWGKTFAQAVETIMFALRYPSTYQYVVAPTQDQAGIICSFIETMLTLGPLHCMVEKIRYSPFPLLKLRNGSEIHARSVGVDGKYLRGHHADRVVLDEAAFIPEVVAHEVIPPMMAASKYGYITRISTPFGRNHFWESWDHGNIVESAQVASFHYPTWTNPFIDADYLQRERAARTRMAWDVEYGAKFHEAQNVMFPSSHFMACVDDEIVHPEDPLHGHRYVIGFDPAKWSDRSGLVVLDITARPWRIVAIQDLSGRDYTIQEVMVGDYSERYNHAPILMDSTSHDRVLESLQAMGLECYGLRWSTAEIKWELMQSLALEFERRTIRIPRHLDFLKELQYYAMLIKPSGGVQLGATEGKHDDWVSAAAMGVHLALNQPAEVQIDWIAR